ncbi:hypothetical protein GGI26_002646 [Coemansia sp. RSA 1358]|nr:hypothetical protein GGI26_002646 [Coemansia sp. RSA 1358]
MPDLKDLFSGYLQQLYSRVVKKQSIVLQQAVVNTADYAHSDEEIDIEMFDSDVELSKTTASVRKPTITYESDSDFEDSKSKRGSASAKRSSTRGRGRGRGRGGAKKSAVPTAIDNEAVAEDEFDIQPATPKARRGRPPKADKPVTVKSKAGRGRKKSLVSRDLSDIEEDEDSDYGVKSSKKRTSNAKGKSRQTTFDDIKLPSKEPAFDPSKNKTLAEQYPDPYWHELLPSNATSGRIDLIDEEHPLELLPHNISDQMALTGIVLSLDGTMLAAFGSSGQVHVWDTDTFECLTTLRDMSEPNIDEFFVGQFTPNAEYLVVGGKLKDRKRWSEADEDNHILPCPLKIFNVLTGEVVAQLEGHSEEILCIKSVVYKGENYFVTTSQDGYIRRWHMDSDWIVLLDSKEIEDGVTCMAFTVSFLPNTGNRFFVASTDDHVTLMDLENCAIVQRFDPIYSSYCDCGKFIEPVEQPVFQEIKSAAVDGSTACGTVDEQADNEGISESSSGSLADTTAAGSASSSSPNAAAEPTAPYAYFVTRGVELLDAEDNTVSSRPNTCTLHRLVYPTEPDGKFELQEIRRFYHDEYLSNSWLIRITSNGRYLLAPTLNGQVFAFNIATGQVTGILRDHDTIEVRDCKFHPTKNLLFTCSDDGTVKIYRGTTKPKPQNVSVDKDDISMKESNGVEDDNNQQKNVSGSSEPESPQTVAVSPLVCLKEGIESMAVHDMDSATEKQVSAMSSPANTSSDHGNGERKKAAVTD